MKNILFVSICCFFLLSACQQTNIDVWEDDGNIALHFVGNGEVTCNFGGYTVTSEDPVYGDFVSSYWQMKENENYNWGYPTGFLYKDDQSRPYYAFGDSSKYVTDTLPLIVTYSGVLQKEGFYYSLKQQAVEDYEMLQAEFLWDTVQNGKNQFFFEGGAVNDTVRIVLKKPEVFGEFRFNVVVDSVDNVMNGIVEKGSQLYIVKNEYVLDQGVTWNKEVLGEFSQEKYAFFQTVIHLKYTAKVEACFNAWWNKEFVKTNFHTPLVEALEKYNAENPGNPKPFTFPPYEL